MKIETIKLENTVWLLLIPLLLIDSINGYMYENNISFFFSISQVYKLVLVLLMLLRLVKNTFYFKIVMFLTTVLLLPTFFQWIIRSISIIDILNDIIFLYKYISILIAFFYFKSIFEQKEFLNLKRYFNWIKLSYFFLVFSICLRLIGIGYPMYVTGEIGSRGFFIAGNEISALLLILSGLLGYYYYYIEKKIGLFIFYGVLSFITGLIISSKTGMLGILLLYALLIVFSIDYSKIKLRKAFYSVIAFLLATTGIIVFIANSAIFNRYSVFWNKLDLLTFMLSSRNVYLTEMLPIYESNYSFIEKIIGVGNNRFEELATQIIEIDIVDIFFTYGYIGVLLFITLCMSYLNKIIVLNNNNTIFIYAKCSIIIFSILIVLSCLSGHIFNSGIAGVFIGFVMAIAFCRSKERI